MREKVKEPSDKQWGVPPSNEVVAFERQRNIHWPPRSPEDVRTFFMKKEAERLEYEGFSDLSDSILVSLDEVAFAVRSAEPLDVLLPLKRDGYLLYDQEKGAPNCALMETFYQLTGAVTVIDERVGTNPFGRVLVQGRHNGQPMNFIEGHYFDDLGKYMMWRLVSDIPSDLVVETPAKPQEPQSRFYTTGESLTKWDIVLDKLIKLPPANKKSVIRALEEAAPTIREPFVAMDALYGQIYTEPRLPKDLTE